MLVNEFVFFLKKAIKRECPSVEMILFSKRNMCYQFLLIAMLSWFPIVPVGTQYPYIVHLTFVTFRLRCFKVEITLCAS